MCLLDVKISSFLQGHRDDSDSTGRSQYSLGTHVIFVGFVMMQIKYLMWPTIIKKNFRNSISGFLFKANMFV